MNECASIELEERNNGRRYVKTDCAVWILDAWWPLSVAGMMLQASYFHEGVKALCYV